MRSDRAKVLHQIAGVPMIHYVVQAALKAVDHVVVVVGHQAEAVREVLLGYPMIRFALQTQQLGTGHAVMCAMPEIPSAIQDVVVLCGDTPLIRAATIRRLVEIHRFRESDLTLLTTKPANPFGYGRVIVDAAGKLMRIVEEADASESEKRVGIVNTGTYCIHLPFLKRALADLTNDNAQGEFYLTDVVEDAYRKGRSAVMVEIDDPGEVMGVNTRDELTRAQRLLQRASEGLESS